MIFSSLIRKVLSALRLGLPVDRRTLKAVEHMLKKRDRASKVMARALIATLLYTTPSPERFKHDLSTMELILSQWMKRIMDGEEEFYTAREKEKLVEILARNNFPNPEKFVMKLVASFSYDTGEVLQEEISSTRRKVKREKKGEIEVAKKSRVEGEKDGRKEGEVKLHT